MYTNMEEETPVDTNRTVVGDRLWIAVKSTYLVIVHAVIIVSLVMAISRHDACSRYVDGDLYAKRLFLEHGNGNFGVEIGAEHDGSSMIRLNDSEGRARLVLKADARGSRIDGYSDKGSHVISLGECSPDGKYSSLQLRASHGTVVIGSSDQGAALSILNEKGEAVAYIGSEATGIPEITGIPRVMLNDTQTSLDLRTPWFQEYFNRKPSPWRILPVSQ